MTRMVAAGLLALSLVAGFGCNGGAAGPDASPLCRGTVPTYSQLDILNVCTMCHSSNLSGDARHGALPGINFNTYQQAVAAAPQAVTDLMTNFMPPSTSGLKVTDSQKQAFYAWAMCGTPQ